MKHEIRAVPRKFERFLKGNKTFEVVEKIDVQSGDIIEIREWDPDPINRSVPGSPPKGYVEDSSPLQFEVGYIQTLDEKTFICSLLPIKKSKSK